MNEKGFRIFPYDPRLERWADAARLRTLELIADPDTHNAQLRHGRTWFVGVDILDNDAKGQVGGVPFHGPWEYAWPLPDLPLHPAQVSIVYPGYPERDPQESGANHRYRITRHAAHVDGLLPVGLQRRRYAKELHAYILGIPLTQSTAAPTVVWEGSHKIMQKALQQAHEGHAIGEADVTDLYQAARREVFECCPMRELPCKTGEAFLLHRFALHGTSPWGDSPETSPRMIAFFRPQVAKAADWLGAS